MKNILIKKRMVGTGAAVDLSNTHYDMRITLKSGQYAVLVGSYYEHPIYIVSGRAELQKKVEELSEFNGLTVFDANGHAYHGYRDAIIESYEGRSYPDICANARK